MPLHNCRKGYLSMCCCFFVVIASKMCKIALKSISSLLTSFCKWNNKMLWQENFRWIHCLTRFQVWEIYNLNTIDLNAFVVKWNMTNALHALRSLVKWWTNFSTELFGWKYFNKLSLKGGRPVHLFTLFVKRIFRMSKTFDNYTHLCSSMLCV